jgi:HEPN domain-containing protein
MSEIIEFTKKWIAKAEADLKAAKHLLDSDDVATDAVCFHSQQTVEKYLKAFLAYHGVDFPKTHDVSFCEEEDGGCSW